ncbi:MAG: hypothetical protein RBT46_00870 [Weeksellaceae bacterium]|jgi:ComF family protein|nr:hypothetical protein [Weeksellaceae bacterium]MDX9704245.1 hypothetical protein [Weeksellaceae bacterium]
MQLTTIGRSVFDLFFPKRCLNCDSVLSEANILCVDCTLELPFTYWNLDDSNSAYQKLSDLCSVEAACSLLIFRHDTITQKLLHALKYNNNKKVGIVLAEKLNKEMDLSVYSGIIPIPIHPKKLKKRGYNQVIPFAKTLADKNGIPLIDDFLIRVQNNPSQVSKSRKERLNSIQNAFKLTSKQIKGHFLLVDDVLTSGATLSICVNLIHSQFPEVKISVLTIASVE